MKDIASYKNDSKAFPLISIIIPIYNAEKYIGEAVQSVINSTYPELEVILVNDGSQDNSVSIAEEVLSSSSQLYTCLNNQTNLGVSVSRNVGLNAASGEFVIFLDADDVLAPNACALLYQCADRKNADVVFVDRTQFGVKGINLNNNDTYQEDKCSIHRDWLPVAIGALIRRDFLMKHSIKFQTGMKNGEDAVFTAEILANTKKTYHYSGALYGYRKNVNGQATSGLWENWNFEFAQEFDMLCIARDKLLQYMNKEDLVNKGNSLAVWILYIRTKKNAAISILLENRLDISRDKKSEVYKEYPIQCIMGSNLPSLYKLREFVLHCPIVNTNMFYRIALYVRQLMIRWKNIRKIA